MAEKNTGDVLDIPRGTPHRMWNPGEQRARVLWQTRPALRTEEWFRSIDAQPPQAHEWTVLTFC
jgi:mannose-6-phosphate isomerase-like protein (cupin superfamily)